MKDKEIKCVKHKKEVFKLGYVAMAITLSYGRVHYVISMKLITLLCIKQLNETTIISYIKSNVN